MRRYAKLVRARILISSTVLSLFSHFSFGADDPKYVPVASYRNTAKLRETVGARAYVILRERKINCVEAGSYGNTVSVPADRADEALQLLAKAIKSEGLRLTLLVPNGDRYIVATPDSVLEPKKEQ